MKRCNSFLLLTASLVLIPIQAQDSDKAKEKTSFLGFFKAYFYDSYIGTIVAGAILLIFLMAFCFLKIQYRHQEQFLEKNLAAAQEVLYKGIMCQEKLQRERKELADLHNQKLKNYYKKIKAVDKLNEEFDIKDLDRELISIHRERTKNKKKRNDEESSLANTPLQVNDAASPVPASIPNEKQVDGFTFRIDQNKANGMMMLNEQLTNMSFDNRSGPQIKPEDSGDRSVSASKRRLTDLRQKYKMQNARTQSMSGSSFAGLRREDSGQSFEHSNDDIPSQKKVGLLGDTIRREDSGIMTINTIQSGR